MSQTFLFLKCPLSVLSPKRSIFFHFFICCQCLANSEVEIKALASPHPKILPNWWSLSLSECE
jgi:hypothetical protein